MTTNEHNADVTTSAALSDEGPVRSDRALVEAHDISKRFGSTVALADAKIEVRPQESHALVGRNGAGKSTLVAVLTGLVRPDTGAVRFSGEPAPSHGDTAAWQRRVACVYQRSTVVPTLTVAENLFLNRQPTDGGRISWPRLRRESRDLLDQWGVGVDVGAIAGDLNVEDSQLVEIARALSFGARFIILDEPTAQLDGRAIERLFGRMRALQQQGVTFLYISHHLQEIYEVCQTVTVFRDARHIVTAPVADLTHDKLIAAMTGEEGGLTVPDPRPPKPAAANPPIEVSNLIGEYFHDISLNVQAGELVGIAGAATSGKNELAETIYGLRRARSGTVKVNGRTLKPGSIKDALDAKVGFVPQDRHRQGLVLSMSIAENSSLTVPDRIGPGNGVISPATRGAFGRGMIERLDIKASDPEQRVDDLSGGNQQKVVMARALADEPRALVLINPTAGVDVKSKESLLSIIDAARDAGAGALIISDELDDLRPCDRVVVIVGGRIVAEKPSGWNDNDLVSAIEGLDAA